MRLKVQAAMWDLLAKKGPMDVRAIARALKIPTDKASDTAYRLMINGRAERVDELRDGRARIGVFKALGERPNLKYGGNRTSYNREQSALRQREARADLGNGHPSREWAEDGRLEHYWGIGIDPFLVVLSRRVFVE